MSFRNSMFTRFLAALATMAMTNFAVFVVPTLAKHSEVKKYRIGMNHENASYAKPLKADTSQSFHYGLDRDNVSYAQLANGTKGRFVSLSPDHFRLQIQKGKRLGEVEFIRLSDRETSTRFAAAEGGRCSHTYEDAN